MKIGLNSFFQKAQTSLYKSAGATALSTVFNSYVLGKEIGVKKVLKHGVSTGFSGLFSTALGIVVRPAVVKVMPSFLTKLSASFLQKHLPTSVIPTGYAQELPAEIVSTVLITTASTAMLGPSGAVVILGKVVSHLALDYLESVVVSAVKSNAFAFFRK
jgi:hypothetical protein